MIVVFIHINIPNVINNFKGSLEPKGQSPRPVNSCCWFTLHCCGSHLSKDGIGYILLMTFHSLEAMIPVSNSAIL